MTLPCPPNPVKAKKAAAARAAKEAKAKKPPPMAYEEEEEKKAKRAKSKSQKSEKARMAAFQAENDEEEGSHPHKQTKWYMGQYGSNDGKTCSISADFNNSKKRIGRSINRELANFDIVLSEDCDIWQRYKLSIFIYHASNVKICYTGPKKNGSLLAR